MNTWKVVLATLVIFVAGIVTGALLVRSSFRLGQMRQRPFMQQQQQPVQHPVNPQNNNFNPPRDRERMPGQSNAPSQFMRREFVILLDGKLGLTPEQRERVEQIMSEGQERIQKVREKIDPEIRREMAETREQIREVLTPEQRQQFEQLMKQRLQRRNDEQNPNDRRPRPQQPLREPQQPQPGPHPPAPNSNP